MLSNINLARRHLFKAFALGTVAVLAKATPAWAPCYFPERAVSPPGMCQCFGAGTRIRVPGGERRVEDIVVGDFVMTFDQGPQQVRAVHEFRTSEPTVCVGYGAFASGVPDGNLYLTSGHAIWTAGGFATVESLVNDETIAFMHNGPARYFHIELATHAVLYANGLTCESLGPADLVLGTRRSRVKSHLRSAFAPWVDRRRAIDIVRDNLPPVPSVLAQISSLHDGPASPSGRLDLRHSRRLKP